MRGLHYGPLSQVLKLGFLIFKSTLSVFKSFAVPLILVVSLLASYKGLFCLHFYCIIYLTIIPRARIGYEMVRAALAMIFLYPTFVSGIIVLLKTSTNYGEPFPLLCCKNKNVMRTVTVFVEHGITAHIHNG